jgi:hypothetical protein
MIVAFQFVIGSVLVDVKAMRVQSIVANNGEQVIRFHHTLSSIFKITYPLDQNFPKVLEFSEDNKYMLVITEKPLLRIEQEIMPEFLLPFTGATADTMHQMPNPKYAFSIWLIANNDQTKKENYRCYVAKCHFPFKGTWAVDAEFSDDGKIVKVMFADNSSLSIDINTVVVDLYDVVDFKASSMNGSCRLNEKI